VEQGLKPVEALNQARDRLLVINLRGGSAFALRDLLQEIYRQGIKPSLITVSPTGVDGFEEAVRPVMAERIDQMSRTTEIRGPDRLTPEDRLQIEAALPKQAAAKPKTPRRLLVLDINIAYGGHRSIPAENFALQRMGEETGAYEAVFSDNLDNLKYPKIKDYDAIFLNNTVGMIFVDPEVRDGLTRFIREGGGLAGNHGTSHASMDWPGFSDMIGVRRGVHRANTEEAWIKIDDPRSPLTAAFDGVEFLYTDEFFRFPNPPYSRNKLHILLSIDVQKTDMNQGQVFVPGSSVARPDADYAVSWVRDYGKGRVFFCILGHNPTLFKTPALAQYFLAGIQFILGDLDADATPSSRLSRARLP
jgi:type 1 glutamine amidotransferase